MIFLSCVPLIIVTFVAINNARNQLELEIISSNTSQIYWSGLYMDEKLEILNNIMFSIMVDREITRYLETEETLDKPEMYAIQTHIINKLSSLYFSNMTMFDEVMLFKQPEGKAYSIHNGQTRVYTHIGMLEPWNQLGSNKLAFVMKDRKDKNFILHRTFFRFIDRKVMGGVSLDVKWSVFEEIFRSLKSDEMDTIFVLDEQGEIVHEPFADYLAPDQVELLFDQIKLNVGGNFLKTDEHYVFYQVYGGGKLYLVKMIPQSVVSQSSWDTFLFSIIIIFTVIMITIIGSIFIATKVTSPILKLIRAIRWTEERNSDLFIQGSRKDEIGVLQQKYAEMIQKRYQIHIEKRNAQIKALQAQINPHFLHNTLQSIGAMAVAKEVPEIYSIIQAMSNNFRYTMSLGNDLVTLKEELAHVDNYLIIQKFRYKDKIDIVVNTNSEHALEQCMLPPLTLQPIVENAFEHGFKQQKGRWLIQIDIQVTLNEIMIIIEDNGIGISEDRMKEITESLACNVDEIIEFTESMALANIHARLKTSFGSDYGLKIESFEMEGTKVSLTLPYFGLNGG